MAAVPGVGAQDGGQDADRGRLARPIGAEQTEHGAGLHLQRHAVEGADVALLEHLDQIVRLDGETGNLYSLAKKLSDKVI